MVFYRRWRYEWRFSHAAVVVSHNVANLSLLLLLLLLSTMTMTTTRFILRVFVVREDVDRVSDVATTPSTRNILLHW